MPTTWCCPPTPRRSPTTPRCATRRPTPIALLAPGAARRCRRPPSARRRDSAACWRSRPTQRARAARFALHPLMGALQTLFNADRRLAIVPNVGPLVHADQQAAVRPVRAHPKPISLFSHNDQQNTWQALAPEGATHGLGRPPGRPADQPQQPAACSPPSRPRGYAVWLAGASVRQYQVSTSGAIRMGVDGNGRIFGSADRRRRDAAHRVARARHARVRSRPWPRWPAARSMPSWRCAAR